MQTVEGGSKVGGSNTKFLGKWNGMSKVQSSAMQMLLYGLLPKQLAD